MQRAQVLQRAGRRRSLRGRRCACLHRAHRVRRVPVAASGRPCRSGRRAAPRPAPARQLQGKIEPTRGKIGSKKGAEQVADERHRRGTRADRAPPGRRSRRCRPRRSALQADLDAKRAELESLQADLRSERARLVRLRARLREARAMLARAARRALQGRQARHPHRRPRTRNGFADLLERTEFIQPDLRPGPPGHHARAHARRRDADRHRGAPRQARDAPAEGHRASCSRGATRSPRSRASSSARGSGTRARAAGKPRALSKVRETATSSRSNLDGLRGRSRRRSPRSCASPRATRRPARSGRAPGSSSGRSTARSRRRSASRAPGHLHAGLDIGVRRGHADPRRRLAAASCSCRARRRRAATATSPASSTTRRRPRATRTSRASATSMGANVSQGQVIGYVGSTGHSLRRAPALRGPHQRLAGEPGCVPVGR